MEIYRRGGKGARAESNPSARSPSPVKPVIPMTGLYERKDAGTKSNRKGAPERRKKNDPKRNRKSDSEGRPYKRHADRSSSDRALVNRGASGTPANVKEIEKRELEQMNHPGKRGPKFRIAPITVMIIYQYLMSNGLEYRSVTGWAKELLGGLYGLNVPSFSRLWARCSESCGNVFPVPEMFRDKEITVAVDSSGISASNCGMWCTNVWGITHGWLKIHAMVEVNTGTVIAYFITPKNVGDAEMILPLLDLATSAGYRFGRVLADGGYDTYDVWNGMEERAVPFFCNIRSNAKASFSKCPSRAKAVRRIEEIGKKAWCKEVWYGIRWLVEVAFSSLKRMFGECVSARTARRMRAEMSAKIRSYNEYKLECFS